LCMLRIIRTVLGLAVSVVFLATATFAVAEEVPVPAGRMLSASARWRRINH
jgi:hypothetical protein